MPILKTSFKNAFTYRISTLSQTLGSILRIFILIALWQFVYRYDKEMQKYMVLYVILSNVISIFYSQAMGVELGNKVADGSFALDLIRPVSFVYIGYMRMLGQILADALMRGASVVLFFTPMIWSNFELIRLERFILFIIVVILGHFLYTILFALVGLFTFLCFEFSAFYRVLRDTIRFLSGSFIPLAMFPEWLKKIGLCFPFRFLYSFPIELLLGNIGMEACMANLLIMCGWLAGLLLAFGLLFKRTVNAFVVQGG